jgi:pimeloyl-ACP methyl ester carboxylesterase
MRLSAFAAVAVLAVLLFGSASAQPVPGSWSAGTPVKIPTGGVKGLKIDGMYFRASGANAHPVMIYLHGLPGYTGDLDLPLPVSRAGWNVLTLHYRGSWGSPGDYSYAHQVEDAAAAIAFVRDPANVRTWSIDSRRIVLTGHSTGGLIAMITAANTPRLAGLVLISASDDAAEAVNQYKDGPARAALNQTATPCSAPLSGCTNQGLDLEVLNHASSWTFAALAPHLTKLPILMVTCNDPYAPENDALENALVSQGAAAPARVRLNTGHAYADQRPALASAVIDWLQKLPQSPTGVK